MAALTPLFVTERNAASMLDMTVAEFQSLVANGALPGPVAHGRWDVAQLAAIMRGHKPRPAEEFDL